MTEVIPAVHRGFRGDHEVFDIPDPAGANRWTHSAPTALRAYINDVDEKNDWALKPLIRLLKSWKYHVRAPIQSIYLELVCADMARIHGLITPSIDMARILNFMREMDLAPVQDPCGISSLIFATGSYGERVAAKRRTRVAAARASKAVSAELEWRAKLAFVSWKLVFGPQFPTYE